MKIKFDENHENLEKYFKMAHIDIEKFTQILEDMEKEVAEFFSKNGGELFLTPFDTKKFSQHKAKLDFISKFVEYVRDIELPLIRVSSDRSKLIRETIGRCLPPVNSSDLRKADKFIDKILKINTKELRNISELKERGLYVDLEGNSLITPSSRVFEVATLEDLLMVLLIMLKSDITLFSKIKWSEKIKIVSNTVIVRVSNNKDTGKI